MEISVTKQDIKKAIRVLKRHRLWQKLHGKSTASTDSLIKEFKQIKQEENDNEEERKASN